MKQGELLGQHFAFSRHQSLPRASASLASIRLHCGFEVPAVSAPALPLRFGRARAFVYRSTRFHRSSGPSVRWRPAGGSLTLNRVALVHFNVLCSRGHAWSAELATTELNLSLPLLLVPPNPSLQRKTNGVPPLFSAELKR